MAALAASLAFTAPAIAQEAGIATGPAPGWIEVTDPLSVPDNASGMVFVRRQQTEVHLTGEEQFTYNDSFLRMLHPNALQLGNIALTWNPAAGDPVVHTLRIHRDGEIIDVLGREEFTILRREDQLEAATIDGLLTASLRVPDLRVGDDLEFAYTVPTTNPTLRDRDFGVLFLGQAPAPGRLKLRLSWEDAEDAPRTRMIGDIAEMATRSDRAITIAADNPGQVVTPRDAPPRYSFTRILEYTDFADWRAVSSRFDGLFDTARSLDAGSPVAEEAARIARNNQGEMERARAALDLVTRQVRYIYVGLNDGALTPASAEETWQRRYGDCKGKTALLLALLDELDIEAEAVLVSNSGVDDGLDTMLPSPGIFDHVLVRATIDGRQYWMDGTLHGMAIPTERPVLPYRWVLPLSDAGATIEEIEWRMPDAPREISLFDIDASGGFDAPAAITQTTITRGVDAIAQYVTFSALTEDQIETGFRGELEGSTQWDSVDDVTWRFDREAQASIISISGTGQPDWDRSTPGEVDLILPGGGYSPPQRRQRESGQDQDAPYFNQDGWACHVTTVRVPRGTKPAEWSYSSTFETYIYGRFYRRMFDQRDGAIRMISLDRIEANEVDAERAERDNARLSQFDNSMARITYEEGSANRWPQRVRVPTTNEVDWLTDHTACVPDYGD